MFVHYEHWDASGKWGRVVRVLSLLLCLAHDAATDFGCFLIDQVYRRVLAALILYHFVMFGMFVVKAAVVESFLIFPLFLFDILVLFYANKVRSTYRSAC
jgi:hypothetical protein